MSIICVRNHAEAGAHRITCPDHEGWVINPGECYGCLPRAAEVGYLCAACYERAVAALSAWSDFEAAVRAADGRLVSPEGGPKGAAPSGYSNLTLSFLTLDECHGFLASRAGRTVDVWVQDETGARDAIRFAAAAERAYRDLEVEEREKQVVSQRCPNCGYFAPTGNITRDERGATVVSCPFCAHELARIRPDVHRWVGSPDCEVTIHDGCRNIDCRCDCHQLGAQSRPGGVQALWDADQHTVTSRTRTGRAAHTWREPVKVDGTVRWITHRIRGTIRTTEQYRADWTVQDALTIEHTTERTAA